jgi:hypothetical protein
MVQAGSMPTLAGLTMILASATIPPILGGVSSTGLSTVPTFPTQFTTITPQVGIAYAYLT